MIGINNPTRKRDIRIQFLSKLYLQCKDARMIVRYAQTKYGVTFKLAKDYAYCAVNLSSQTAKHFPNLVEPNA